MKNVRKIQSLFMVITNALDFCLKLKGEERKVENKIDAYNLQLHAHNGLGFDTWMIFNNLPCDKHFVNIIKHGKGIIELKVLNGYIEKKRKNKLFNIFISDLV